MVPSNIGNEGTWGIVSGEFKGQKKIPFGDNIKYKEVTVKEKRTFLKMFKDSLKNPAPVTLTTLF